MGIGRVYYRAKDWWEALSKMLPARQTHLWELFGQPFREKTFSKKRTQQNKSVILMGNEQLIVRISDKNDIS